MGRRCTKAAEPRAGYGASTFELPAWAPLAGWGARPRRLRFPAFGGIGPIGRQAQALMAMPGAEGAPRLPLFHAAEPEGEAGVLQALGARVLVIEPAGAEAGGAFVLVRLDLVTSSLRLHAAILERFAEDGVIATRASPSNVSRGAPIFTCLSLLSS